MIEYYAAVQRNELPLIYITTWIDFKNMLGDKRQAAEQYESYDTIYLKHTPNNIIY